MLDPLGFGVALPSVRRKPQTNLASDAAGRVGSTTSAIAS